MELNAHELRIGNLFQERNSREVIMVMELSSTTIGFSGSFPKGWQAEPIPLTEEWLLKFGFEELYDDKVFLKDSFEYRDKKVYFGTSSISIQYVHQLQNLFFALVGEELELK